MHKTISIVTVVMNDLNGLRRTFESVESQIDNDFEWLVIDGGSTDGTLEFAKSLKRIDELISESDKGIYDAMRKGMMISNGEYVLFMNAGDFFYDEYSIENIKKYANKVDVLFFGASILNGDSGKFIRSARPLTAANYSVPAVQQATVYRLDVLKKLEWPIEYRICGDYAIAAQLLKIRASSIVCSELICKFELGGVSTKRFVPLAVEAWKIQRKYLNIPLVKCGIFFVRRVLIGALVRFWNYLDMLKNSLLKT